jgi:hypothetical protein
MEREREAAAKKVATQDAKEAKQLERQLLNDLKKSEKPKRTWNTSVLASTEVVHDLIDGVGEEGVISSVPTRRVSTFMYSLSTWRVLGYHIRVKIWR